MCAHGHLSDLWYSGDGVARSASSVLVFGQVRRQIIRAGRDVKKPLHPPIELSEIVGCGVQL